jgi:transcriptional regulator with XRE-family HTH domain
MPLLEKIKKLCDSKGETFASLERKLGFGNATIRKWDDATPSGDRLAKVADFFDVSVDYLLGREKSPDKSELDCAFFRLKKGLEPLGLDEDDADFLLTVYRAHKEKNKE